MKRKAITFILLIIMLVPVTGWAGLTKTQVSQLYVSIFGRASEGGGNSYWQALSDIVTAANTMLDTQAAKDYFGANLNTNQAFIEHIYLNTLNKTIADDYGGIRYWVNLLDSGITRGEAVASLVGVIKEYAPGAQYYNPDDSATVAAYNQFTNRVQVSDYMADNVWDTPEDWETSTSFSHGLVVNDDPATAYAAMAVVNGFIEEPEIDFPSLGTWNWDLASGEACYFNENNSYCGSDLHPYVESFWTAESSSKSAFQNFTNQLSRALLNGNRTITSGYAYDVGYHNLKGAYHAGMDIDADLNDPVYSPINGTVVDIIVTEGENNRVMIRENSSHRVWIFAHITPDSDLQEGSVTAGTLIGKICSYAYGEHLHLEVQTADNLSWWGVNNNRKTILDNTVSPTQAYYEYLYESQPSTGSGECGAYIAPGVWKEFDCYNLAAIGRTTNDDPFTPSWRLIGGYWQWGRKGPNPSQWYDTNTEHFAHGPTGPRVDEANEGEIYNWNTDIAPSGAWADSYKTSNDPCPVGYRVPTLSQWGGVNDNNDQATVGTWNGDDTNYSSGRFFGSDLMLPATGRRHNTDGTLDGRGHLGDYWSSSESGSNLVWSLIFLSGGATTVETGSWIGHPVRCISE